MTISSAIAFVDKLALIELMAWCHQATRHYIT